MAALSLAYISTISALSPRSMMPIALVPICCPLASTLPVRPYRLPVLLVTSPSRLPRSVSFYPTSVSACVRPSVVSLILPSRPASASEFILTLPSRSPRLVALSPTFIYRAAIASMFIIASAVFPPIWLESIAIPVAFALALVSRVAASPLSPII